MQTGDRLPRALTAGTSTAAATKMGGAPGFIAVIFQALLKFGRSWGIAFVGTEGLLLLRRGTSGQQAHEEAGPKDLVT